MEIASPLIQLKDVSVFQENNLILNQVSLSIKEGEFVYFLGKVGSGKSSLLKLLYGEIPLKKGEAIIAGHNLYDLKRKDIPYLRRKLGIVFQDFQLLNDRSVNENLKFVMRATGWKDEDKISLRCAELLTKVGLPSKGTKMPFELSGGEQQRVVIARALVNSPKVILADEPTGNLDPETSQEIMQLLKEINSTGSAVLFATHDILLYNRFPARTIRFESGGIIEQ